MLLAAAGVGAFFGVNGYRMYQDAVSRTSIEERVEEILARPLDSEIHPFDPDRIVQVAGSTDVGDVAYAVPTLNLRVATCCVGNVGHTWQMTAQTCSPIAHKGLLTAAKVIALHSASSPLL